MTAKRDNRITLLIGDDEYLAHRQAFEIIAKSQEIDPTSEREIIDGMVTSVSEAQSAIRQCKSALQSPGLFSTARVVWFKDVTFLGDSRAAQSTAVQDGLIDLVEFLGKGLPAGFTLIITAESIDKRRSFAKNLAKIATVEECSRGGKDSADRTAIVRTILAQHGCTMPDPLIHTLCDRAGSDTRRLVMEAEKLCLYILPETRITETDIETIVSTTTETAFYELANRFSAFDLPGAVRALHELLFQKHSVMGLIAHLENTIRDLLIFREALDQGWLQQRGRQLAWQTVPPEVDEALATLDRDPRKLPPFIAIRLVEGAGRFTRKRLDHCLRQIVQAHEKIVSSRVPPELILEILLVRMLGQVKRTKPIS